MDDKPIATFHAYDQDTVDLYAHAASTSAVLWDIRMKLRNDVKYGNLTDDVVAYLDKLREEINGIMSERHLPE